MQRNQIFLEDRANEENKNFLKELYNSKRLVLADRWFDMLGGSYMRRQLDKDMTLDNFLKQMEGKYLIRLQIGSPTPNEIRYCARLLSAKPERFAWMTCPLTKHNYNVIDGLFKKAYGQDIASVEVTDSIKEYNKILGPLPFKI